MAIYTQVIQNVNTYLTNLVTGYALQNPVADFVAPPFEVKFEAAKYVTYDKTVMRVFDDKISGRERAKEIQWNVSQSTYSCEEYSMEYFVSDHDRDQAVDAIRLDEDAVKMLKRFHANAREYRIQQIANNTAIVTQNTAKALAWATAATGTPVADILAAMATVAVTCGFQPNRIVIPLSVALKMIQCTEWKNYFQYTQQGFENGLFSVVSGLRNLGLEPMITNYMGLSTAKGTASDPTSAVLWSNNVLLYYCEPEPSLITRTFMYSPFVYQNIIFTTRENRERGVYHSIYSDIDELLIDAGCAYLFTNCA